MLFRSSDNDFVDVTKASLSGGFTTSLILPFGVESQIVDAASLGVAHANASGNAYSNYAFGVLASSRNAQILDDDEVQLESKFLFVPFNASFARSMTLQIATTATLFSVWPAEKPIVTDAKGSDLASVLLLASLNNRSVHVTDVRSKEDLQLISLSKSKQLLVTCDVSIYSLFFSNEDYPNSKVLPTKADQIALWAALDVIDAFSVGTLPYELARELKKTPSPQTGIQDALPLLLTAVADGRLALRVIQEKLQDNPVRIFGLLEQAHTQVEVAIVDRKLATQKKSGWSPVENVNVKGAVNRVVAQGQSLFLDGTFLTGPLGRDVSGSVVSRPAVDRVHRQSVTGPRPVFGAEIGAAVSKTHDTAIGQQSTVSLAPSQIALQQTSTNAPSLALVNEARVFSPLTPHPAFHRKHILSVKQFTHQDIHDLFNLAHEMRLQVERNGTLDILKGKVLCTLFYEPSTRTSSSFDAAMKRCGGEVVQVGAERSSVLKGESLPDTIRTLGCYADAIVIRHPEVGSSQLAAKHSPVPILNAGDGIGEHPTQVS